MNYNCREYLQGCIDALTQQNFRDFETIIADNGSVDGSMEALDVSALESCRIVLNNDNLGFARGNNEVAKLAVGEWLVMLNPDTAAHPDWLSEIENGIHRHASVNCFACSQLLMEDPMLIDGAGDNYLICGFPWRGGYKHAIEYIPEEGECFSPCGASLVIRASLFRELGGFDESFFCYCEDVDLGFRLQLIGEACVFLPKAVVKHSGGGSSKKISGFAVRMGTRNRLWTYVKNMPLAALIITLPLHLGFTAAILLRGIWTGRFADTLIGLIAGIRGLGPVLQYRYLERGRRKVGIGHLLRQMSWNPMSLLRRRSHIQPIRTFQNNRN